MRTRMITIIVIIVVGMISCSFVWYYITPAPFSMHVTPRPTNPPGQSTVIQSLAGQLCIFLVDVAEQDGWLQGSKGFGTAVTISATPSSEKASVTIHPQTITPGQVAEVTVIPRIASVNETLTITITGEREGLEHTEAITLEVLMGQDVLEPYAAEMRDKFIPWLAAYRPSLGITNENEWTGTLVNPKILVVMHYIFYSDDWEIYVTWHVTIPPHDWTRVYLRQRFTEVRPSYAFEIASVTAQNEPEPIEVPDWV